MGRRDAARRALTVLGVAAVAPSALAACGGEEEGAGGGGELTCTDTSGLEPAALQTRQSQNYTDHSPNEGQQCDNCRFYQAPQQEGSCGSCQVIQGPVHPEGYCDLYAAQA
ncbi:MAG TPA: high-potential iron-sulfur protein [Sandaracinaceae bacterium LLY-WYZ-13_1]|nr:high-potential iron-sulfur protein [Sandaracinaceae bacterium LLY-WYZ-13_1]